MNTSTRICLILLAALLFTGEASAQVLKWSYTHANGQVYSRVSDGLGGMGFVLRIGSNDQAATVVWLAPNGKVLLDAEIARPHEDSYVRIVRMTSTELAIRCTIKMPGEETFSNVLRRYKKTRKGITVTNKKLEVDEEMPLAPERLTDNLGFFTFSGITVRRYSN